jgi:hypothetical protein
LGLEKGHALWKRFTVKGAMWGFGYLLSISMGYWPQGSKRLEQNRMVDINEASYHIIHQNDGSAVLLSSDDLAIARGMHRLSRRTRE